jgi:ferrous iron transport protein B
MTAGGDIRQNVLKIVPDRPESPSRDVPLIGIAGQPNVGKSTIFNVLTGLDQHVGNWPGKTVERKEGKCHRDDISLDVVDLPGTYGLTSASEEERVTRDFILDERPDAVVMVADAAALERSLYLLTELLLLPAPVVVGLNMMDVAESEGLHIEPHVLQAALGMPVVPLVASKNQGVAELATAVEQLAAAPDDFHPSRPEMGESVRAVVSELRVLLEGHVAEPGRAEWAALKLLQGDAEITESARSMLPDAAWKRVTEVLRRNEGAVLDIAGARYEWIGRMVRAAVAAKPTMGQVGWTDRLDRVALHPVWGVLALLAAFGSVFWMTFSVAAPVQGWLDTAVIGGAQRWLSATLAGAPWWLTGLLCDGILGGAGVLVTFLPILIVFFAALGIMEDTGYLSRAGFVLDRFMHRLGLHGKSLLPLFLGFGCNVPAVLGSRVIESRGGRLLTILLAPFVPCSARLLVLAFIAPAFFGKGAALVSWGLVSLNIVVLAVVGVILNATLFRGERVALIMELPLYHRPSGRTIGLFVRNHTISFLRTAGTIILLVSIVLWALSALPGGRIEDSYLARAGRMLEPFGGTMGMDWRLLVALVSSFIAKENAIAALGVLYGSDAESAGLADVLAASVAPAAALAFLVITMLFIPCAATVASIRRETGSWAWTGFSVAMHLFIAFGAGILVYQIALWLGRGV